MQSRPSNRKAPNIEEIQMRKRSFPRLVIYTMLATVSLFSAMSIAQTPAYQGAAKAVGQPTSGFGYLDLKTLFERSYGTMRPFIAMSHLDPVSPE